MARTIHIPMSFEFRIKPVRWVRLEGHIVGASLNVHAYRELMRGTDGVDLRKAFSGRPILRARALLDDEPMGIDVGWAHMPYERWELDARVEKFVKSSDVDTTAIEIFSDYRPQFFIAFEEEDEDDDSLDGDDDYFHGCARSADAWHLREAFLKLDPDAQDVLGFLNRWGFWNSGTKVQLEEILSFQHRIRRALLSRTDEWLSGQETLALFSPDDTFSNPESRLHSPDARSGYPNFRIRTYFCHAAISATVTFDLLGRVRFKRCSRPDCRYPFPITSRHRRKYCTQYCAHLESVRRTRKLTASREKKGRATKARKQGIEKYGYDRDKS